jgi:hypothetical protein
MRVRCDSERCADALLRRIGRPERFACEKCTIVTPFEVFDVNDPDVRAFLIALRGGPAREVLAAVNASPTATRVWFWKRLLEDIEVNDTGVRCGDRACTFELARFAPPIPSGRNAPIPFAPVAPASDRRTWWTPVPCVAR